MSTFVPRDAEVPETAKFHVKRIRAQRVDNEAMMRRLFAETSPFECASSVTAAQVRSRITVVPGHIPNEKSIGQEINGRAGKTERIAFHAADSLKTRFAAGANRGNSSRTSGTARRVAQ